MARRLTDAGFLAVADRFKLLSDPARLKILYTLRQEGELPVGVVAERLGCSQPNASRHLARLHDGRMVERRHQGTQSVYFIEDPSIFALCEMVCGKLERERESAPLFAGAPSEDDNS